MSRDADRKALLDARLHIERARSGLLRVHPVMEPEEPCIFYEVWSRLGAVGDLIGNDILTDLMFGGDHNTDSEPSS